MTEMNTSIVIPAPPDRVWESFMDTKRWAALFGGVLVDAQPETPWQQGSTRILKIRPFRSARPTSVEVQVQVCERFHLRWTSRAPGLAATRFFTVAPAEGGSLFRNCEHVTGFIPRIAPRFVTRALTRTHEGFNGAFRDSLAGSR
jgi:uncharacterized protein YndB with AHSA1/START domain